MGNTDFITRWNMVRRQVRQQLIYMEEDLGYANLARWWDLFMDDLALEVENRVQTWARDVIQNARQIVNNAQNANGPGPQTNLLLQALDDFERQVERLLLPAGFSLMPPPGLPPPGDNGL